MQTLLMPILLLVVAGTACAPGSVFYQPTPEETAWQQMSPAERFSKRWEGKPEDDVILHYGRPDDVLSLSSGNRVDSYHREVFVSESRAGAYGNVASSRSNSTTIYCDRRFEIDLNTAKVARAIITGSNCDFGR